MIVEMRGIFLQCFFFLLCKMEIANASQLEKSGLFKETRKYGGDFFNASTDSHCPPGVATV